MSKHLKTLVKEKPRGATHYDKGFNFYLDCSDQFNIKKFVNGEWVDCAFRSGSKRYIVYVGNLKCKYTVTSSKVLKNGFRFDLA